MAGWYIWRGSEAVGPINDETLAGQIKTSEVTESDWLWHERLGTWTMAGQVRSLWPQAGTGDGLGGTDGPVGALTGEIAGIGGPERHGQAHEQGKGRAFEAPSLTALYLSRLGRRRGQENGQGPSEQADQPASDAVGGDEARAAAFLRGEEVPSRNRLPPPLPTG